MNSERPNSNVRVTRVPLAVAGLLLGGAAIIVVSQHQSQTALRSENERLRQQLAQLASENETLSNRLNRVRGTPKPRLPAPPMRGAAASESAEELLATNLIARLVHGGEAPRLSAGQIKGYLDENHRSAGSLLSAYRTSGDPALLKEALEKYPGDPEVAFEALLGKDASPAERREWLEAFKQAAPENPMANYLSALDYFKAGQTDQAVQELIAATGRQSFADYPVERIQADEEAYRAAGYSEADAKMAATWGVALPQLADLKSLAQNMVDLAASYRGAGDETSAQAALQMVIALGEQMDASSGTCVPLVTRLVGLAVERMALSSMDPSSAYGNGTVQDQLDQLAQRKNSISDLAKQLAPFQEQMSSEDWVSYNERTLSFGEENAIGWLLNKYGQQ
ncbi:conserved exported hypothetical protein [Verrucomicrobia bacterium]|nr:conserved exported hypothetical protein [Verrucomicrobiota bacterium]